MYQKLLHTKGLRLLGGLLGVFLRKKSEKT